MTDDKPRLYNLSRRKLLGGLGAVGLASAGAGLGTSAYFTDTEAFRSNRLQAGELDLVLDWQQTYYGPDSGPMYGTAGRPYVSAYPDGDGDGVQDHVPQSFVVWAKREGYDLADPAGRHAAIDAFKAAFFANGADDMDPLVELTDVKPGDWGEVTMSIHFFDNPSYVRMVGGLVSDFENGATEPERASSDTTLGDPGPGEGELDEATEVLIWADDGDNVYEPRNGAEVDVVVLFDTSCSMEWADSSAGCSPGENTPAPDKFPQAQEGAKALFEELLAEPDVSGLGLPADMVPNADVRVGLVEYGNDTGVKHSLGASLADLKAAIDGMSPGNSTELPTALEDAKAMFDDAGRADAHRCVIVIGDGQPHDTDNNEGDGGYAYDDWGATYSVELTDELESDYGAHVLTVHYEVDPDVPLAKGIDPAVLPSGYSTPLDTIDLFEVMASYDADLETRLAFGADRDRLTCVLMRIARMCAGEVPLFYGTLAEALEALDTTTGDGILLVGNPRVDADDAIDAPTRACLEWSCTYYTAFKWMVPTDVGNEIQTDSVVFDIGFEAEQCRHNEVPFATDAA
ncbi:MAG: vWA domain-containing protein [Haloarculaceae archaeon]